MNPASDDKKTEQGMSSRGLAVLVCKTLAVILFAVAAITAITTVGLAAMLLVTSLAEGMPRAHDWWIFSIPTIPSLAVVLVGGYFWINAEKLASKMITTDTVTTLETPFTISSVMVVSFSVTGLIFVFSSIKEIVTVLWLIHHYSISSADVWQSSSFWSSIIHLGLGVWLTLGARGIVNAIRWLRTAGTPDFEDAFKLHKDE